ncbi:ATP-binding protein [Sphingomonas sp. KR1UV-12]|uniref:histidine kinase n=1 Tax=Sphingomonas aurea TaxID=3063994 RepID=A0ABT9EFW2_9SPHN|nr:ATP-binding protein [Sphingomonas sp. KR1UV-12]MDP1025774.1 ATP-binding protein [Sphingomonas sp. KR1UV-12]
MALLAGIVLIALIVTLRGSNRERDHALELQRHSYDVMILARSLAGTIARSEASLGRYVISGDVKMGQLYFDDWRLASSQIDRLDQLTSDNAAQDPAIERLRAAYAARGRDLSTTALSTTYGRNSQALARYYQSRKARALLAINGELDDIIGRERRLLESRVQGAAASVDRSSRIASVLGVFGLLLVLGAILLGWLSVKAVNERVLARADADAARERAQALATAVAEATAELQAREATLRQVQKMEAVGQLTGGIAHDFNNMLAVVLGGLELARRQVMQDPVAAQRHLDNATEGANRAAALTRRLLAFSREETLKPEPIAAGELITDMSELLDRTLGDGIVLEVRNDAPGWQVRVDRVQLENVVLNLAVNARDALAGRGTIRVLTAARTLTEGQVGQCAAGDYVVLAVADDGCGMTPEVAERVFEPFYTTKEAGKGTGLGLSQVFAFVRGQMGEITIDTAPDCGTTVTLYLPRATTVALPAEEAEAVFVEDHDVAGLDVLVVEDDPRVLTATVEALEELGHRAIGCDDPSAAADLLASHPQIGLLVSDVLMPRQTGPEMVAGLRDRFPHVAVMFVTGYAGESGSADLGAYQVLRKPFTLARLERAIAETMRGRKPLPQRLAAE